MTYDIEFSHVKAALVAMSVMCLYSSNTLGTQE